MPAVRRHAIAALKRARVTVLPFATGMSGPLYLLGAVVLGGSLIFGGSSTALGTLCGSFLLILIVTTMQIAGLPAGTKATELPTPDIAKHEFLKIFGQPERQTVCACERASDSKRRRSRSTANTVSDNVARSRGPSDLFSRKWRATMASAGWSNLKTFSIRLALSSRRAFGCMPVLSHRG